MEGISHSNCSVWMCLNTTRYQLLLSLPVITFIYVKIFHRLSWNHTKVTFSGSTSKLLTQNQYIQYHNNQTSLTPLLTINHTLQHNLTVLLRDDALHRRHKSGRGQLLLGRCDLLDWWRERSCAGVLADLLGYFLTLLFDETYLGRWNTHIKQNTVT